MPRAGAPAQVVTVTPPGGEAVQVPIEADRYVRADAGVEVQVIAVIGTSLIIVDTHLSLPGGSSFCQAGEERFLRIFRLGEATPQETLRLKLASCWQSIELDENGLEWSASDSSLQIHWLFGPTIRMRPEDMTLRLSHQ